MIRELAKTKKWGIFCAYEEEFTMKTCFRLACLAAALLTWACTFDTAGLRSKNSNNNNTTNNTNNINNTNNANNLNNLNNTNNTNNPNCGNGVLDAGETCDGTDLGGETCSSRGFAGGTLACAADCASFDETDCTLCGNGVLDPLETCDGTNLGGATCEALQFPGGGTLACTDQCTLDTSGCIDHLCGNGLLENTEACDGTNLGGETCSSQGFFTGNLLCAADCNSLDTSLCTNCGNNQLDSGEVCDGTDLGGQTCYKLGCRINELPTCSLTCNAISINPCKAGHDEDSDTVDDNCDNCPSVSNTPQPNGDGDEIGDSCERPNNQGFISKIIYFEPFASAPSGWNSVGGGSWTQNADAMQGTVNTSMSNDPVFYLYYLSTANDDYIVEANFSYRAAESTPGHRAGVVFAYNVDGDGNIDRAYRCVFERNTNQLQLWRYTTYNNRGWQQSTYQDVSNPVNFSSARTIRAFVWKDASNNNHVICQYIDANHASGVTTNEFTDSYSFSVAAQAGLTLQNEMATFTSFVYYAN